MINMKEKINWNGILVEKIQGGKISETLPAHLIEKLWKECFKDDDTKSMLTLVQHEMYPSEKWLESVCLNALFEKKFKIFRFLIKYPFFIESFKKSFKRSLEENSYALIRNLGFTSSFDNKDLTRSEYKRLNLILTYASEENNVFTNQKGSNFVHCLANVVFVYMKPNMSNWISWFEQKEVLFSLLQPDINKMNFFDFLRENSLHGYKRYDENLANNLEKKASALLMQKELSEKLPKAHDGNHPKSIMRL